MSSLGDALAGEFEACYRVYIDVDGNQENEKRLTMNVTGWDGMIAEVKRQGYTTDQIIDYTVC